MRTPRLPLWAALAACLLSALPAPASEPKIRHMDPVRLEAIRAALQGDVTAGGDRFDVWFGNVVICAPHLWGQIQGTIDHYKLHLAPAEFTVGTGVVIRGLSGNRDLAEALAPLVVREGTVRLPTDKEFRRYWANFPFEEIEDPVYVISSPDLDLLIHLQLDPKTGRYFAFLVESFRP
jgi:hypothetical protein